MPKTVIVICAFFFSVLVTNAIVSSIITGAMGSGAILALFIYPVLFISTMLLSSTLGMMLYKWFTR